jgi:branched-chain amino acid transport system permease protein
MDPGPTADEKVAAELGERMLVEQLRELVTPELVEEHRRNPVGFHSFELERVLRHLRRQPLAGKYVLVCSRRDEEWAIGELSGTRGIGPRIVGDERFSSLPEAQHGVFRARLRALGIPLEDFVP